MSTFPNKITVLNENDCETPSTKPINKGFLFM